jgi:hypothetical protein
LQIVGRMPDDDYGAFCAYCGSFGLDKSVLALLLIRRELTLSRLGDFRRDVGLTEGPMPRKVVARFPALEAKMAFDRHAAAAGLKPTTAAGILYRAELKDRWLERAIKLDSIGV